MVFQVSKLMMIAYQSILDYSVWKGNFCNTKFLCVFLSSMIILSIAIKRTSGDLNTYIVKLVVVPDYDVKLHY